MSIIINESILIAFAVLTQSLLAGDLSIYIKEKFKRCVTLLNKDIVIQRISLIELCGSLW